MRVTRNETGALPVATYALIVAQVVAWFVVRRFLLAGGDWLDFAIVPGVPREFGLLISPFIHLDPAHLGVNVAVLWLFGVNLERVLGSLRFLSLYLGAAWFASVMQWAVYTSFHLSPDLGAQNAAVGSSGAIAGVLGVSVVRFPGTRLRLPLFGSCRFPASLIIALWFGYTVFRALVTTLSGVTEGVGHWAHFGGFIFGLSAAQLLRLDLTARQEFLERTALEASHEDNLVTAAQAWSALLSLRPADLQVRLSLVRARLALTDLPGAGRLAREGIENPVRAGDRATAVEAYVELVGLIPGLELAPGIRYRVGCWLADSGRDELAFKALWESVREDGATPAAASALYRAGQVAWDRLRNARRARAAWERLLEQFPDSPWSDAARDGLRRLTPVA